MESCSSFCVQRQRCHPWKLVLHLTGGVVATDVCWRAPNIFDVYCYRYVICFTFNACPEPLSTRIQKGGNSKGNVDFHTLMSLGCCLDLNKHVELWIGTTA